MQPGTKVYVRWYGRTLEGEVAGSDGFMGMTPVRIPLDGHHPVALFMPQHVYDGLCDGLCDSPEKLTEISVDRSKVAESLTEIFEKQSKVDTDILECFKESHWDEAHNHLRTDSLEEFYQLWRKTHDCRPVKADNKAILSRTPPIPVRMQPVLQNGTPSNTKPQNKKMRCWKCEHLDYDHILCRQENRAPGEHYCGLHGMARVDPDGPQQNLNRKGGCGFTARKQAVELSLFD